MAVGRVRVKCWLGREGGGLVSLVVKFRGVLVAMVLGCSVEKVVLEG